MSRSKHKTSFFIIIMLLCTVLMMPACKSRPTVGDLTGELIYIDESGTLVPYIVVTNDYADGKALLLRKEVLPESHRMNEYSSYYNGSEIDNWLNEEYLASLGDMQDRIEETEISVAAKTAIGYSGDEAETISRKVFLLSATELAFDTRVNFAEEGTAISYFKDPEQRIAYMGDTPESWLLRSPDTYYESVCCSIDPDGKLSLGNAYDKYGIRPAFCVDKSLETETVSEDGQSIHAIP